MTTIDPDRHVLGLTDREGTGAMRTYSTLLVSGALAPLALGATMIVHGDWQPALAAFAGLTGGAFLLCLTRLLAIGERLAGPAPSAPRRRALARPAPAADHRREAAPSAAAPPRRSERLETIELDHRRILTINRMSAPGRSTGMSRSRLPVEGNTPAGRRTAALGPPRPGARPAQLG
jgi:hypothetical protein